MCGIRDVHVCLSWIILFGNKDPVGVSIIKGWDFDSERSYGHHVSLTLWFAFKLLFCMAFQSV